ncbi:hydroxypyruvate isomerase family protein [Ensifer soli]|uniref:hydroxypyruvate isomerase family protein n=1 Tax=Ciceribacter sp. sgz301302 TaxID=3342379 RepID=UPI0035B74BB3
MPRFSANLGFLWPDRPLLERIDAAGAAGFRAVELHWPQDVAPDAVRARCAAQGLRLLGINTPPGRTELGEFGLGALPGRESEFLDGFSVTLDWARRAGAGAIHVMAGVVPPGARDAARATLIDNLRRAAGMAPEMTLLLEGINQTDRPGYFYSTLEAKAGVLAETGAANVRILFDAYHVGLSEGDVLGRLERYLPLVGHVQIAAVPSRAEPDEGEVDYRHVFDTLDRLGYAGWVGCEYRPRAGTDPGLDWVRTLGVTL